MNLYESRMITIASAHFTSERNAIGVIPNSFIIPGITPSGVIENIFAKIWQIHPFREGNTRTVVMMLTFFVEHYGYYMDQELLAESAGYVRDSFVMASLDQFSEYEYLERILMDAVCDDPIEYELTPDTEFERQRSEKYQKYQKEHYTPEPHYRRED